ncbi:hypothetical protein B0H65DRAFT_556738 [Neurospora tetraspora]|uniref:Uncharacterized protein n=1 Tax=Neurospora tetraspora TaxID=94610 RepID=A0AAE0MVI5_9PEZI|nr:hypothetical protein B0H65DRAFT_556738 [Neurospora tetraspora]
MAPVEQQRSPPGRVTLQQLPQEVIETIAEFCGDISGVSPSEQTDTFTEDVVKPYLDSTASNTWSPVYNDLRALALVSRTFSNPAQRALFKVAMVKTTGHLMRLIRSLLLYPNNRRYVRCFVAAINDHVRWMPQRLISPQPLVLVPLFQETLKALNDNKLRISFRLIDSMVVNLHTLEDQLLTATVQLCPKITATRICFYLPHRHAERGPQPTSQPAPNPPIYASLLDNHHLPQLKALTLDFGALLSLTNLIQYVQPGYPTGLPPSVERLTLVGNKTESELPYHLFDLNIFAKWLGTNKKFRELRMLDGFDKLIMYHRFRNSHPQPKNWNNILLSYRDTLEVLVLDCYSSTFAIPQGRFGASGMLDCLPELHKLRYIKAPLHAFSGNQFGLPLDVEDWEVTWLMRTGLPPWCRKIDVMVRNPLQCGSGGERMPSTWRVVEFRL